MKKMKKNIVVISIMILIYLIIFSKPIIRIIAFSQGIVNVESIYYSPAGWGPLHVTVLGKDNEGKNKGIWIKSNYIPLETVYSVYLENGISEKDVIELLNENNFQSIYEIYLVFASGWQDKYSDKDSIYWIAIEADKGFDGEYAVIDFYTGKILEINTHKKRY